MWVGVGVLLGLMVLASVVGFHVGLHSHLVGIVMGTAAAVWLVVMAATGSSSSLLWTLFGADLVVSGGLAMIAWKGFVSQGRISGHGSRSLAAAEGVSVTDLTPEGVVRVRGENWSATSLNGSATAGSRVQVVEVGVRLSVWCEESEIDRTDVGPDGHTKSAARLETGTGGTEHKPAAQS
jgi:membrane-bound ClpP family serine protease